MQIVRLKEMKKLIPFIVYLNLQIRLPSRRRCKTRWRGANWTNGWKIQFYTLYCVTQPQTESCWFSEENQVSSSHLPGPSGWPLKSIIVKYFKLFSMLTEENIIFCILVCLRSRPIYPDSWCHMFVCLSQGLCRLGLEFFSNGPENIYLHQTK